MDRQPMARFYMKVPLPDGSVTDGRIDYSHLPDDLGLSDFDLSGQRVLDIAANDGFWSFWAEQQGADEVLAIDVDGFDGYDWGWSGPPPDIKSAGEASNWTEAAAGFWELHKAWNSQIKRRTLSVYDLDPKGVGTYDLIFNFGLLYHLRHPLLSLDRARAVCAGCMILETHVVNAFGDVPASAFYRTDELNGAITNWTGPNEAAVASWLLDAGFPHLFCYKRTNRTAPYARRIFIACVDDKWRDRFLDVPTLGYVDEVQQANHREALSRILGRLG